MKRERSFGARNRPRGIGIDPPSAFDQEPVPAESTVIVDRMACLFHTDQFVSPPDSHRMQPLGRS